MITSSLTSQNWKKETLLHKVTHLGGMTQFWSPLACHGGNMETQNPSMDRGDQIL
jgi:hypothetical protein